MPSVLTPSTMFWGSAVKSASSPFSALHWLASAGVLALDHLHHPTSLYPCANALALLPYDQVNTVADGNQRKVPHNFLRSFHLSIPLVSRSIALRTNGFFYVL